MIWIGSALIATPFAYAMWRIWHDDHWDGARDWIAQVLVLVIPIGGSMIYVALA